MNLFDFFGTLRRRGQQVPDQDWQVGDLALCITDAWALRCQHTPRNGDVLRVAAIFPAPPFLCLAFEGKPASHHWAALGFRKIRPAHDPADAAFRDQMLSLHPRIDAEPIEMPA